MNVQKDFEDLLRSFNRHKVKYCIAGAYAVAFYGKPRYTKDIDILIDPTTENGNKIVKALDAFGFKSLELTAEDFTKEGQIIQLGYEPIRIDILTSIQACPFVKAWKNRKRGTYGKEKAYFLGLEDLIKSKKKSKRKQDQADIELLIKSKKKK